MSLTLRPYQQDIIDQARELMRQGVRSILLQLPTGAGKTVLTAKMLKTSAEKGMGSWFVVHRRELIKQSIRTFETVGVRHGVVANGFFADHRQLVQIASVQTLANRYVRLRRPKLIVWDEAHHVAAAGWSKIFDAIPDAFHIGLTATPERLDGTGLGRWFNQMIQGPSVSWLIENGFLAPYRLFAPGGVNLAGVHTRMGDFVRSELQAAVDKPTITGDAIRHYQRYANGKRAVVFCVSIEHSKHVCAQFNQAGIPAAHVDGETEVDERDNAIRRFENGAIRVLCNVELFGEGFDLPALEVAILLRPTHSLGLYLQQVGRALRTNEGKSEAIILDHVNNVERHGLPDEDRAWSLSGRGERSKHNVDSTASVRICPKCFAAQFPGRTSCSFCGAPFEVKAREVVYQEGELQEIDTTQIRRQRMREQGQAQTFEDLVELGKARGYKRPHLWAKHLWNARQARKLERGIV